MNNFLTNAVNEHRAGNLDAAAVLYQKVIKNDPQQAQALLLLGLLHMERNEYELAESCLAKGLKLTPKNFDGRCALGAIYLSQKKFDAAIEQLQCAVEVSPKYAQGYRDLGYALVQQRRWSEAIVQYRSLVALEAQDWQAHNALGVALKESGNIDGATASFEKAIATNASFTEAYYNLAVIQHEQGELEAAAQNYQIALVLQPEHIDALSNLGAIYRIQNKLEESIACFERAVDLSQASAKALNDLGVAFQDQGDLGKAINSFDQAINKLPNYAEAHLNRAKTQLLAGNLAKGWEESEWYYRSQKTQRDKYPYPLWDGSALSGKTILIHAEQGVGDEVMFACCFNQVIEQAGLCVIECDPRLVSLFQRSFPKARIYGVDRKANKVAALSERIDFQIASGSLPRYYRNTFEHFQSQSNWLMPDAAAVQRWKERLAALGSGLKVGISWKGGNDLETRLKRSIALPRWKALLALSNVRFINLQYGKDTDEVKALQQACGITIYDWEDSDALTDLDNFTAQIAALDLVISIDNSTVHLAGAIGVPVWTLLPFSPDWRWLRDYDVTPWYPTMKLYRQSAPGEWDAVLKSVHRDLSALAEGDSQKLKNATFVYTPKASATDKPVGKSPRLFKAALLNDTSSWYHWGCTCTSTAIRDELEERGAEVIRIPIEEIYRCERTPNSTLQFDNQQFFDQYAQANRSILDRLNNSDVVIINGEGTLHNVHAASLNLLYLAYIAKTRLGKAVQIINHSCYPDDSTELTKSTAVNLYKKVYQVVDYVAIREELSAALVERMGVPVTRSFDCLPLFIERNYALPKRNSSGPVIIAGSVAWNNDGIKKLCQYIEQLSKDHIDVEVLVGAKAYPASDDKAFIEALLAQHVKGWKLKNAVTVKEWLDAIANARLVVSGRFHYSIAAAFLNTPFIILNSNTPKMNALMQMLERPQPLDYQHVNLASVLYERTQEILRAPEQALVGESILAKLRALGLQNFAAIEKSPLARQGVSSGSADAAKNLTNPDAINVATQAHPDSELERRLNLIARQQTDLLRWGDSENLNPAWDKRAAVAANFFPAGAIVLDLGCGRMTLEKLLPPGCQYLPCDVAARDDRTQICDFNRGEMPQKRNATHISVLGVLEYIFDAANFLNRLRAFNLPVILSYCPADYGLSQNRAALGQVNSYTVEQLVQTVAQAGFDIKCAAQVDENQLLLSLNPNRIAAVNYKQVTVVHLSPAGTLEEQLTRTLIDRLMPVHAIVSHVSASTAVRDIQQQQPDLLILGGGNLSPEDVSDDLLDLLARVPKSVGLFGTQHRHAQDQKRLTTLISRLTIWLARHEEDALLYGGQNTIHAGDWLIDCFSMAHPKKTEVLNTKTILDAEVRQVTEIISSIQNHDQVFAEDPSSFLCALTSAHKVAYRDIDDARYGASGVFRSVLIDIFGRTFEPGEFFEVDKQSVLTYKNRVRLMMGEIQHTFAALLDSKAS